MLQHQPGTSLYDRDDSSGARFLVGIPSHIALVEALRAASAALDMRHALEDLCAEVSTTALPAETGDAASAASLCVLLGS